MSDVKHPDSALLPDLFKKNSKGGIQYWAIKYNKNVITVTHGKHGGKMQVTEEVIEKGKNLGKANETTPAEQARLESISKWEKQVKKGYVTQIVDAEEGKVDETVIEGGINPMLAHKYTEHPDKIQWPCYSQPKLDGIRCIAVIEGGVCTLWSRTRKVIIGVPHINEYLAKKFAGSNIILDGELYNHKYKNDFEKISHFVGQKKAPEKGHEIVQYHVYDIPSCNGGLPKVNADTSFEKRAEALNVLKNFAGKESPVVVVETVSLEDEDAMNDYFDATTKKGYEGVMLRNAASKYENKRSYNLQKVKEFIDEEFEIVGMEEARGKRAGQAIVILKAENGKEFGAVPMGTDEHRKEILLRKGELIGKLATVKYQNLTADGIPRFPVLKTIRDYE